MIQNFILLIFLLDPLSVGAIFNQCSSKEAAANGKFHCFDDCDSNHLFDGTQYCLTYLPDGGSCYMKSYTKQDILVCDHNSSETRDNHWLVWTGGSNMFFVLKVLSDMLIEVPVDSWYDPWLYYNANSSVTGVDEMALIDIVVDAEGNVIHKSYYGFFNRWYLPPDAVDIFMSAPTPPSGGFRISYLSMHLLSEFQEHFNTMVDASSEWVTTPHKMDVYIEWTGLWGDGSTVTQEDHMSNINFLKQRAIELNLNLHSFLMSDSSEDCGAGRYKNTQLIINAFAAVQSDFEKYYYSKRDMIFDQYELTSYCFTDGHAFQPMDHVFITRIFNILCNGNDSPEITSSTGSDSAMICPNFEGYESQCFYKDEEWMSNLFQVCPTTSVEVSTAALNSDSYCPDKETDIVQLPQCLDVLGRATSTSVKTNTSAGFDAVVIILSLFSLGYILYESFLDSIVIHAAKKGRPRDYRRDATGVKVKDVETAAENTRRLSIGEAPAVMRATNDDFGIDDIYTSVSGVEMTNRVNPIVHLGAEFDLSHLEKTLHIDIDDDDVSDVAGLSEHEYSRLSATAYNDAIAQWKIKVQELEEEENQLAAKKTETEKTHKTTQQGGSSKSVGHSPLHAHPSSVPDKDIPEEEVIVNKSRFDHVVDYFKIPPAGDPGIFEGVNFARYLASIHIVLGHMYQGGHLDKGFAGLNFFGYTWVPFYFLVSGHILTCSEIKRRAKLKDKAKSADNIFEYVHRRLTTLYPTYILGIICDIGSCWWLLGAAEIPEATDTLLSITLLQSWVPSILEKGMTYLVQCWFMSCLLFYWFLFFRLYDAIYSLSSRYICGVAFTASIGIPVLYVLAASGDPTWYDTHQYLSTTKGVDIATVSLKYHPMAYLHIFVLGMCLPHLRELLLQSQKLAVIVPYISAFSYFILLVIFCGGGENIPGYNLSFRLGLISIFQCTLLIGLCNERDLLATFFCHPFLKRLGLYGFPQYIFQFMVWGWFHEATGEDFVDVRYFLLLFSTSVIVWTLISRFNGKRMNEFVLILSPLLVMYLILQPYIAAHGNNPDSTTSTGVVFTPKSTADDFNIDVTNNNHLQGLVADRKVFNPSILQYDEYRWMLISRRDYVSTITRTWYNEEYLTNKWETEILVGFYRYDSVVESSVAVDTSDFTPCVRPLMCNSNGTVVAKVTTGPEDPRLFKFRGDYYISVFSYDNINSAYYDDVRLNSGQPEGAYDTGSEMCKPTSDGLIGRMYVAKIDDSVPVSKCMIGEFLPVEQSSFKFPDYSIIKNWLSFVYMNYNLAVPQEDLYFIHQISPFFVVMKTAFTATSIQSEVAFNTTSLLSVRKLDATAQSYGSVNDDALVEGENSVMYYSAERMQILASMPHEAEGEGESDLTESLVTSGVMSSYIHGSANSVFVPSWKSPSGMEYYMAIMHTLSNDNSFNYAHYPFVFCSSPPFRMSGLGLRLDLNIESPSASCNNSFAFVSGLAIGVGGVCAFPNDYDSYCVIITYGVCDQASRIKIIKLSDVEDSIVIEHQCA